MRRDSVRSLFKLKQSAKIRILLLVCADARCVPRFLEAVICCVPNAESSVGSNSAHIPVK